MNKLLILAALLLSGCATQWRVLTAEEVRAEVAACKAVGMVPEMTRERGRVVWVA